MEAEWKYLSPLHGHLKINMKLNGYDIDGVLTAGIIPESPYVVISGRTFAEYDAFVRDLASKSPVYIRGVGKYGDQSHAGNWKAHMVDVLGVTDFWEDDLVQAGIIKKHNPTCNVHLVK